jgi:hypothetical protein
MDDTESLKVALHGAYAVYLVTNYWETMSADVERKQGKNVADVAKVMILHPISSNLRHSTSSYLCRKLAFNTLFSAVY